MTPVDTGRHCSSCQKTVVNFSGKSDAQIIAFYAQKENEKTCGQFRKGQLDHINKGLTLPARKTKTSFFRPILASAILFATACTSNKQAKVERQVQTDKQDGTAFQNSKLEQNQVETDSLKPNGNDKFEPRKITHIKQTEQDDTLIQQTKDFKEIILVGRSKSIDYPTIKREQNHLGGVPAIIYKEEIEVGKKGMVRATGDTSEIPFLKRVFKRKK